MSAALDRRRSGVLLHMASLPPDGQHGVLGGPAHRFVDLLADTGFTVWQTLPVGPAGTDGSPYFSVSAHAGNTAFADLTQPSLYDGQRGEFDAFVEANQCWLFDDALYFALKREFGERPWWEWPAALRDRQYAAVQDARQRHRAAIDRFTFEQFLFYRQWRALKEYANRRGIRLFGDMPIYVAHDSAEVWTHRADFQLDAQGLPTAVSGVPPDYFSKDGQLWGNPLYDWPQLKTRRFSSWIARVRTQLERFDLLRIDHFRGLQAYWSVPYGAQTARDGHWVVAAGDDLLRQIAATFGKLPLIAEDLGLITKEVIELRDRFELPGMCVLQFGFDGSATNPHLPHNYPRNAVAYTGTHDNDTTVGWYSSLEHGARGYVDEYLAAGRPMPEALIRACLGSVAHLAVVPLQDLLAFGGDARMNTPGTTVGNWGWTFNWQQIPGDFVGRWRRINQLYGRI